MSADHPQLTLLFALEADHAEMTDEAAEAMRIAVESLAASRPWTIAPPEFVYEEDDSSCTEPDDLPIVTIGAFVKLYSSYPPWGERLPIDIARAQYNEVKAIVDAMMAHSLSRHLDLVFEYDDEAVGFIEGGFRTRA